MGFSFEKLNVYREALDFTNVVYDTTKHYPKEETFGITNQLRRASMSIALNIAEGSGRGKKEFKHFLNIARTSGYECVPLLEISKSQSYINNEVFNNLYEMCNSLVKRINALKNSISSP